MVITEVRSREDARAFLNALAETSGVTERPYAGHMLFLVTGLELDQATLLLGMLRDLDTVTGPYLACHLFVGKLKVPTYVRLVGIGDPEPRTTVLSLPQIEGLSAGPLNHIELEDLQAADLTAATEAIARALGVVEQLPCIVVLDASEVATAGNSTVVAFPHDRDQLSAFIRAVVGAVASYSGIFRVHAGILEAVHQLFDQRERLRRRRAAPTARKVATLEPIFQQLLKDPLTGLRELKRVHTVVGLEVVAQATEAATYPSEVRESAFADILRGLVENDEKVALDIVACEQQIRHQRSLLSDGPSLSKVVTAVAKAKELTVTKKALTAAAANVLKSTLSDVAKPSFWLKLFGL